MISLDAFTRDSKTKGQLSAIRDSGNVPAIVYGGKGETEKISISKKLLKSTIEKENFLSNILTLSLNGKNQNVLPREVTYDVISDEPIHVDFLRVVPGVKIRKVELNCPSEKIPGKLTIDLDGVDIGESFKISSIELESDVTPTIQGRDFVIATLAAPTVMKEPEKPAEAEAAEGEGAAGTAAEGDKSPAEGSEGEKKEGEEKKAPEAKK